MSGKPQLAHFLGSGLIGSKYMSRQSIRSSEQEIATHRMDGTLMVISRLGGRGWSVFAKPRRFAEARLQPRPRVVVFTELNAEHRKLPHPP